MVKKSGEAKLALAADQAAASSAKDGNALVSMGLAYAFRGDAAKGVQVIEQGIEKGGLKRPEDAKLYLGLAQSMAGDSSKAQTTWRSVKGNDGAADLARLWAVQARSAKR